ncbi:MAG: MmgE/PrpD family protein [Acetobacterales bacterium]
MAFANTLADRVCALGPQDLTPDAIRWGKVAITDTIACMLAGAGEPCVEALERALRIEPTKGPCLVLGRGRRAGPLEAALVNGTAAHALDFDDVNKTMGGHPSAPLLPVLLALADLQDVSGRDLLLAYAAGFETACKLGRAVNFHHYEKGWHPTATLGTFGATAAAGRLLGLDPQRMTMALSIAVSFASGVKANFGSMTKPLHVGHAARGGLFAAQLAREGFTAQDAAFDHRQGFFELFNGAGTYDPEKAFENWAAPLDLEWPAVGIKRYPSCASTHSSIDALLELMERESLANDDVVSVRATIHPRRYPHVDRPDPQTPLDAKFSLRHCIARALLDGAPTLAHFHGETHREPRVLEAMTRVETGRFPPDAPEMDNQLAAEVAVTTRDGRTLVEKIDQAVGRGPEKPVAEEGLRAKFHACCTLAIPRAASERLHAALSDLENLPSARVLTDIAAGKAETPRRAEAAR